MFERFTKQARDVVVQAQREARELRHGRIGTEHVWLALLAQPDAPGVAALGRMGVAADQCRTVVAALVGDGGDGVRDDDTEALKAVGIDLDEVRRKAEEAFGEGALDAPLSMLDDGGSGGDEAGRRRRWFRRPRQAERGAGHLPFTARAKKALELSLREAIALKDREIGAEHILLGVLRCDDRVTATLFQRLGVQPKAVREQVLADLRRAA